MNEASPLEQGSEAPWRVYRQFKISHINRPTLDTNSEHAIICLQNGYSNITKETNGTACDKQILIE
jgi:hypothetical protein